MGTHGDALLFEAKTAAKFGCAVWENGQHGISVSLRQPLQPLQARLQPAPMGKKFIGARHKTVFLFRA